jgi:hypothetical protein
VADAFEQPAVGFLDILGFKQLIEEAEASASGFERLAGLKAVLDARVRFDNDGIAQTVPEELKPRYIFISDSIILSAPLLHGHKHLADGLAIVVVKAIQIAQKVIELGHLVRGGIYATCVLTLDLRRMRALSDRLHMGAAKTPE